MPGPHLFTPEQLRGDWPKKELCQLDADGVIHFSYAMARPTVYPTFWTRLRLAWGVLVGRYDALWWRGQER